MQGQRTISVYKNEKLNTMLEIVSNLIKNPYIATCLVVFIVLFMAYIANKYTRKPLRVILMCVGVLMIIFRTQPGAEVNTNGIEIVTTLLIPVTVILILMVLLLDALMAKVMQQETQDIRRYQYATKLDLAIVFIMVIEWFPYFREI